MRQSYFEKSRLSRREEKRAYRRIFLAIVGSILLIVFIVFLGIPALINLATFIASLQGEGDLPARSSNIPLSPPSLDVPYEATNTAEINLEGTGTPGARVEIFVNGNSVKKLLIPNDGSFTVNRLSLESGENKIWAVLENSLRQRSERSQIIVVTYKNEPPKIEITEPNEDASFSGDNKEVRISGQTEEGVSVTINERVVIVDASGKFSYSLPLGNGENRIEIVAKDVAGNVTRVERKVTYSP